VKNFLLLAVVAILGWLWTTGKLSELAGRGAQGGADLFSRVQQSELYPMGGSGAVGSVRNLGQGVAGSYGRMSSQP
jgi:hypothetical protein